MQRKSRAKHGHGTKECWAGIDYMYRQSAGRNGFRTECERHGVECGEKLMRNGSPQEGETKKVGGTGRLEIEAGTGQRRRFVKCNGR